MGAKYLYSLDNTQPMTVKIVTNAAVVEGDILAITSGLVGPLANGDEDIIGIGSIKRIIHIPHRFVQIRANFDTVLMK